MIVVDASVAMKWFLREPLTREAMALLESGSTIVAPSLIRLEVTSGLMRNFLEGVITAKDARAARDKLELAIKLESVCLTPDEELWQAAVDLSFQIKHGFPDCFYLTLAQLHGVPVVTADDKMHKRGVKAGIQVIMLPEYAAMTPLRN